MTQEKIRVRLSGVDYDTAYVELPGHTGAPGFIRKTIRLDDLIAGYRGPFIAVDFDAEGRAVGVEILVLERDAR